MSRIDAPEFWQWAFSDFMSNSLRGILAEFIVAKALGCAQRPRTEWNAYDLVADESLKIEVKSSAYLQTWEQKQHSVIRFNISHKKSWDAQTNTSSSEPIRPANVYVFCVFSATEKATADPLNLEQWFFLACSTQWLNKKLGNQKSVGLAALERFGLERLSFGQLAGEIRATKS